MANKNLVQDRRKRSIDSLYYITLAENLPSILQHGILSHRQVLERNLAYAPVYDSGIVSNRRLKMTPQQRSLWDYANLYFEARNAMLYRLLFYSGIPRAADQIVVLQLRPEVMKLPQVLLADGNAASAETRIFDYDPGALKAIARQIDVEYWSAADGSKRRLQAELLVPDRVPPEYIESVYVASVLVRQRIEEQLAASGLARPLLVIADPYRFFQPNVLLRLNNTISLARGDMFFSRLQTLTISVNTKGVMGKGLASRARYQFPAVYVQYQDACRTGALRIGKPLLIQREQSIGEELAQVEDAAESTWFLLFPTKDDWRAPSKLEYIETGMQWLLDEYERLGIRSLALPALGCGLGGLAWADVGPLMCRYADRMGIPVCIYLPNEVEILPEQLTAEFLLG